MTEVSMAGSVVVIKPNRGNQITLTEFADDSDPIVIPDLEIRKGGMNLNGNLVSWAAPNPVTVSLSVIPNTPSDKALSALIRACHLGGKSNTIGDAFISAMTISVPASVGNIGTKSLAISKKSTKWTFKNGYITSGPAAQGTNAEGKASTKTYTFTFESVSDK